MRFSSAAIFAAASLASVGQAADASSSLSGAASAASSSVAAASSALTDRLSSIWGRVKSNIPAGAQIPSMPSLSSVVTREVKNLTARNWEHELGVDTSVPTVAAATPWLVLFSGGNQTCEGRCRQLDAAWTIAAASAKADARAPNLAYVTCETNRLLCATWGASAGTAWWIEPARPTLDSDLPAVAAKVASNEKEDGLDGGAVKHAAKAAAGAVHVTRDIYVIPFNHSTVGADDITRLYRRSEYKTRGELLDSEGALSRHPFDGQLAKTGLLQYVGYVYFALGMVPSWTVIMVLSMTMRMFMTRQQVNRETPSQKAERERKEKFTADGKVRGAPPGDGRSTGLI